jgi:hypothetical protein
LIIQCRSDDTSYNQAIGARGEWIKEFLGIYGGSDAACKRNLPAMKLTPSEILYFLGFDVPPEGIEVNLKESNLYLEVLRAHKVSLDLSAIPEENLGCIYTETIRTIAEAIDVTTIPDSLLRQLDGRFSKLIIACREGDSNNSCITAQDAMEWLSALMESHRTTANGNKLNQWGQRTCASNDRVNTYQ